MYMSEVVQEVLVRSIWKKAAASRPTNSNSWKFTWLGRSWKAYVNSDMSVDIDEENGGYFRFGHNEPMYSFKLNNYTASR